VLDEGDKEQKSGVGRNPDVATYECLGGRDEICRNNQFALSDKDIDRGCSC
jgi:uncharacterized protein YuzB (UPF0349 family)